MSEPTDPIDPTTLVLRAARPDDLAAFERIAAASAHGITSLPSDRAQLADKLERSHHAFTTQDDASGEEIYLFVLEDTRSGRIVGSSGITASAGFHDRFYSYRNEFIVHASQALNASNRVHTLHLCHDLTGYTLLTSFYIEPAYEPTVAAELLSRGRLLFIAEFAERFSDRIAAESPGLADEAGQCPFWDAVGRRFFDMDYPQVERITGGRSRAFIADLMPQAPIYVPLLPEAAQWAIGQLHPVAERPFGILLDEGFDADTYVDIFDGGPTVEARVGMVRTVAQSMALNASAGQARSKRGAAASEWHLVSTTQRDGFRAVLGRGERDAARLSLDAQALQQLNAAAGDRLRAAPLGPLPQEGQR